MIKRSRSILAACRMPNSRMLRRCPDPIRSVSSEAHRRGLDFLSYLDSIRPDLKPPVSNKLLFGDQLKVMIVGGPNHRRDYHVEMGEELFYQIEGGMDLDLIRAGGVYERVHIPEGHVFTLPAGIPHSPQRYENTLGVVFERDRLSTELDCLRWYDERHMTSAADKLLNSGASRLTIEYEEYFHCHDLGSQLKAVIENYHDLKEKFSSPDCFSSPQVSSDVAATANILNRLDDGNPLPPPRALRDLLNTGVAEERSRACSKLLVDSEFNVRLYSGEASEFIPLLKLPDGHSSTASNGIDYFVWQIEGQSSIRLPVGTYCATSGASGGDAGDPEKSTVHLLKGDVTMIRRAEIDAPKGMGVMIYQEDKSSRLLVIYNKPIFHNNKTTHW